MAEVGNEFIYEILKSIQSDVSDIKKRLTLNEEHLTSIRHLLTFMRGSD